MSAVENSGKFSALGIVKSPTINGLFDQDTSTALAAVVFKIMAKLLAGFSTTTPTFSLTKTLVTQAMLVANAQRIGVVNLARIADLSAQEVIFEVSAMHVNLDLTTMRVGGNYTPTFNQPSKKECH